MHNTDTESIDPDRPDVRALLADTIDRFVAAGASLTTVRPLPIASGASGDPIARVEVGYEASGQTPAATRLVLKHCSPIETAVLERLQHSTPRHVPFAHAGRSSGAGDRTLVCLQDLGDTGRPDSLSEISALLQRREAEALADIHYDNLHTDLDWLPAADREYYTWAIEQQFFAPAWRAARAHPGFRERFGRSIGRVDDAASRTVGEMTRLSDDPRWRTLVHTDVNPSNVLVVDDRPYLIDWGTARRGPMVLDVPHHLSSRDQAEDYRQALSDRGLTVGADEFTTMYDIASTYTGLRYLWWTLEAWRADPEMDRWVEHYLAMIS